MRWPGTPMGSSLPRLDSTVPSGCTIPSPASSRIVSSCCRRTPGLERSDGMEDHELLQGEWIMISLEVRSVKSSNDGVKNYKLTVTGDKWVVTKDEKIFVNAEIRIDQTTEPRAINLVQKVGKAELVSP